MKKGEGISQTYMHDLWTETMIWGLPEGGVWVEVGSGGKVEQL